MVAPTLQSAVSETVSVRTLLPLLVMALLYLGMQWFYIEGPHAHARWVRELFLWPMLLGLAGTYVWGYMQLRASQPMPLRLLMTVALGVGLVALMIEPFHSTDVYGYVNRGWQQLAYGLNPYVHVVDDIPGWSKDPMITNHWVNNPCPYGFLFALLAQGLCAPLKGYLAGTVFLFKALNLLALAGTGFLVFDGARHLKLSRPDLAAYWVLFSPLLLLHQVSNGHNDLLLGFLATLAVYAAIRQAWVWVIPALVAATLVKYAAVVMIPLAAVFVYRQKGVATVLGGTALGLVLLGLLGLPYWPDLAQANFDEIGKNATITHNSFHSVLFSLFKELAPRGSALYEYRELVKNGLKSLLMASYGLGWLVLLGGFVKGPNTLHRWLLASALAMGGLIVVASLKFYPWYLGMFMPLVLLLPQSHPVFRGVIVLSLFQLLAFTVVGQAHILNYVAMTMFPVGLCVWLWGKSAGSSLKTLQESSLMSLSQSSAVTDVYAGRMEPSPNGH